MRGRSTPALAFRVLTPGYDTVLELLGAVAVCPP